MFSAMKNVAQEIGGASHSYACIINVLGVGGCVCSIPPNCEAWPNHQVGESHILYTLAESSFNCRL